MKKYTTEAVVLKNINYGDAHKIYTLLTKDYGKITARAMGVRKITSRRAGSLDTLSQISVSISEDDKGFKTIQEVKTIRSYVELKKDLAKIRYGFYVCDLINNLLENDHPFENIYILFCAVLRNLITTKIPERTVVNVFELKLLNELGHDIETKNCLGCGRTDISAWKKISYNPDDGGIFCENCLAFGIDIPIEVLHSINKLKKAELGEFTEKIHDSADKIIKMHIESVAVKRGHKAKIDLLS